jgi:H+/Cl- antiporter ClcA
MGMSFSPYASDFSAATGQLAPHSLLLYAHQGLRTDNNSKQAFAEVTASISAVTALLYLIPFICRIPLLFIWDTILFILWVAVFGIFGNLYIKANAQGDSGILRMKHAVWIDLVNMLLWLISAIAMAIFWVKHRGSGRTKWTGRGKV